MQPPDAPETEYPDIDGRPQLAARARIMSDLSAMALACDQTRVLTYNLSRPLTNALFPGASEGHHTLTHNDGGDQPEVHEITLAIMDEFSYFLQALDAVPEGDGTMLDHASYWAHPTKARPMPSMSSSSCWPAARCAFQTGLLLVLTRKNSSKVLLSILRGFGITSESFGQDDCYTTDGLTAIEG